MSLRAMIWALESAPVTDPTKVLILVALGDRASDDGTGAYPAQKWLATRARLTERSVRRVLQSLEKDDELIRRGDQRMVAHLPTDRRPVVWDLALEKVRPTAPKVPFQPKTKREVADDRADADVLPTSTNDRTPTTGGTPTTGRTPVTERGDAHDRTGGTPTSAKPSLEVPTELLTILEPPQPRASARARTQTQDSPAFNAFWAAYPRRESKGDARKAWKAMGLESIANRVIAGAERYAADPNRLPQYTKHPATWLRAECWDDAPLPIREDTSRGGAEQARMDRIFGNALEWAREADAADALALDAAPNGHLRAINGGSW